MLVSELIVRKVIDVRLSPKAGLLQCVCRDGAYVSDGRKQFMLTGEHSLCGLPEVWRWI